MLLIKKDFFWNILASISYGAIGMVLFIGITRISGSDISGQFSVAFVTAQLFMYIGNYGVRAYQASDIDERYSFREYLYHRIITSILMIVGVLFFIVYKGYDDYMIKLLLLVCLYKMTDVIADVFEGRLQQEKLFYKAGISLFFRTVISGTGLIIILLLTKDILIATIGATIISMVLMIILSIYPVIRCIKMDDYKKIKIDNIYNLFKVCFPLFSGMFMISYIINSPKYAIENSLSYDCQTYYSALYFPAQMIYLITSFIFKPILVPMAEMWKKDKARIFRFTNKLLIGIVLITAILSLISVFIGTEILGLLYGLDFSTYTSLLIWMMLGGGCIAVINMLCNILTVLRKQKILFYTYFITFLCSLSFPNYLVQRFSMDGAVYAYVILLFLLALMLLGYYHSIRRKVIIR